jgi:hypothetical protein
MQAFIDSATRRSAVGYVDRIAPPPRHCTGVARLFRAARAVTCPEAPAEQARWPGPAALSPSDPTSVPKLSKPTPPGLSSPILGEITLW